MSSDSILVRARRHVENNHPLSTQHVILEALESPGSVGMEWTQVLSEIGKGKADDWKVATRAVVDQENNEPAPPRAPGSSDWTEKLSDCEQAWKLDEAEGVPLTDALIVLTIIAQDTQTWGVMKSARLPTPRVVEKALRSLLFDAASTRSNQTALSDTQAHRIAMTLVKPVNASTDRQYAQFSSPQINNALRRISDLTHSHTTPICVGSYGSLIDMLEVVLADHYGTPKIPFEGPVAALNTFDRVYKLDLAVMRRQPRTEPGLHLDRVLEKAKEKAKQDNAILLIDHIELIRENPSLPPQPSPVSIPVSIPLSAAASTSTITQQPLAATQAPAATQASTQDVEESIFSKLRDHIANRGECFIIGLYRVTQESQQQAMKDAHLGDPNVIQTLAFSSLEEGETLRLLESVYFRRWRAEDFTFTRRSFDGIFELQTGILIDDKPCALPIAAIRLAEGFIKTIEDDDLLDTVKRAIVEAKRLLKGDPGATLPGNSAYLKPLLAALKELKALNDRLEDRRKPFISIAWQPEPAKTPMEVKSIHLLAQLLCNFNESQFAYPVAAPDLSQTPITP
jgi:hypothetical protein